MSKRRKPARTGPQEVVTPPPEDRAEGLQGRPSGSLALWRAGRHPEVDGRREDKE
jgi:hypothetical protein